MSDVVKLVTAKEREEQQDHEYNELVHDEAIDMLRRMGDLAAKHKISGLAIVFVTQDGLYGRMLPRETSNMASLIGALGTAHHDLILRTLTDGDDRPAE